MSGGRKTEDGGRRTEDGSRLAPPRVPVRPRFRSLSLFCRIGLTAGFAFTAIAPVTAETSTSRHDVLVVVGAPGAPEFETGFAAAAGQWRAACEAAGAACTTVGIGMDASSADAADREAISAWFAGLDAASPRPVWFVYLGHGTWDGREARLNLRGDDLTGTELRLLLAPLGERPVVVVHGGSASGPLVPLLAGPNRILVTATTSGDEVNYARFGERFAEAIGSPAGAGDLDMDGQTSVLEAFVAAARGVEMFYAQEGRMATEHALIEDNGDGRGTPAEFFRGTRTVARATDRAEPDGTRARRLALLESPAERLLTDEQRTRRDTLENELDALRARKGAMPEADYLRELERLLRALAAIYGGPHEDS